ncbi:40S ribosomal protein S27 isoform 3 [Scophthalmus maximus]|uniref:40S ribosomal protein S27 n=1 Tax=Scophthalmus maximus TaxID=52904 RepID=A0A2U9AY60_SCOMX|nr:40S ribosomal protein S27 isoform 3 [Scophthalmus maximus]
MPVSSATHSTVVLGRLKCVFDLAKDLLHPSLEEEKRTHKKKRLVQCPNSYFMDVKCPGCYKITTVFSHAQTVVLCVGCSTVLCQPTGGKARLTEGTGHRSIQHAYSIKPA